MVSLSQDPIQDSSIAFGPVLLKFCYNDSFPYSSSLHVLNDCTFLIRNSLNIFEHEYLMGSLQVPDDRLSRPSIGLEECPLVDGMIIRSYYEAFFLSNEQSGSDVLIFGCPSVLVIFHSVILSI